MAKGECGMITKYQLDLMKHAYGYDSKVPGYRNYFAATPDSEDDREWAQLVLDGYAEIRMQPDDSGWQNRIYSVTSKGTDFMFGQVIADELLDKLFGRPK
jgi:hypothetical protein